MRKTFHYHCECCGHHGEKARLSDHDEECSNCGSLDVKGEDKCAESGCEECKKLADAVEIPDGKSRAKDLERNQRRTSR